MVTGQLYGIRASSISYRKDRSFGHLSLVDPEAGVPKRRYTVSRFNLPSDLREGRIPRVHVWYLQMAEQYRTIDSYSGSCMLDSSKNGRDSVFSLAFHQLCASPSWLRERGKNRRHNAGASRKVANARKHRIRKIGGHCCDRSCRF